MLSPLQTICGNLVVNLSEFLGYHLTLMVSEVLIGHKIVVPFILGVIVTTYVAVSLYGIPFGLIVLKIPPALRFCHLTMSESEDKLDTGLHGSDIL